MKYKDIAEKHEVSINTVKSWKTRCKWNRKGVHTKEEKVRTQKEKPKKKGAPYKNANAAGNRGNRNPKWGNKNAVGHGAPTGNDNAVTHGFFRKHFPEEVMELMEEIAAKDPLDMLWENISIQYVAIIRAQRLMFVESKEEMIKELKKSKSEVFQDDKKAITTIPIEEEYEFQFAWDRHATFMNAQSRAMSTLSSLIKQFDDLANKDDKRRMELEQMRLDIEKKKAEITVLTGDEDDDNAEAIQDFLKATAPDPEKIKTVFGDVNGED
ncbi:phage terminase small subunit [Bacillus wiedmannii]|uniref:Phage terminase small subunit n=1 Tax=Bacillus wiedmannii TaxID=1890302 RepID=A0AA95S030_9BACI|nr:phage terminase small subunit [Bacillus wiedmannii]WHY31856.1 phage terminase small subunit [Bacillus wiedmannii]